ncbi:MAG TPA: archaeal proteasome endopeptidase complex subunit beta [Candidatus Deferrimicrobium sp.]|nr:archaeal proteasome endopeptidase complex subunit beta [Candidatus Deferrimicrobium sp.]
MTIPENQNQFLHTGTTTIGIKCIDGIVFASDRRAVAGYYVAHKHTKKIYQLADHIATTIAGVVADAQKLIDYIIAECNLYQLSQQKPIPVKAAANLYAYYLFNRRWFPFLTQTIIGGVDNSGPTIYTLDAVGSLIEENTVCATGSGTPFALGVLEDAYFEKITIKEATGLAIHAVRTSIERDIGSGNGIDVIYINKEKGYNEISDQVITTELKKIGKEF